MFNNLVESTVNAKENTKKSKYFGLTSVVYFILLASLLVWSVFSFDLSALNNGTDLTLETLVAPAAVPDENVPIPKENPQPKTTTQKDTPKDFDILKNPVENIKNTTKHTT